MDERIGSGGTGRRTGFARVAARPTVRVASGAACGVARGVVGLLALGAAGCGVSPLEVLDVVVPKSGYTVRADLAYGDDPRQRVDVYFPDEPAARSRRIVFVYGGAWRTGSRAEYRFVAQALADAGHVVILRDYRLYPAVDYPAFVDDVVSALTPRRRSR